MTFDEAMIKYKGTWDGDTAMIRDRGYTFKVAKKTDTGIEMLFDSCRFVTPAAPKIEVSDPVEAPKRGKRGKPAEVEHKPAEVEHKPAEVEHKPAEVEQVYVDDGLDHEE